MANREITDDEFNDALSSLMKDTSAKLVSDTSAGVMHSRPKILTPIPQLNCIFGGGIPMGLIIEAYGSPATGKSSTWYQTMGLFQKQHPRGICIVVDTESSIDEQRMPFMGVDSSRVMRIPAMTIESGFKQLFSILDKKVQNESIKDLPVFIIWDTIGSNPSEAMYNSSDQFADGMMGPAKLLKAQLKLLLPRIEQQPIIVVLLNQVSTEKGQFQSKLGSSGGWAIKHDAHLRLEYYDGKTEYDDIFAVKKNSGLDIVKSKISPLFNNLSLVLDIRKGGIVDTIETMCDYARNQLGYISNEAWCTCDPVAEKHPEFIGKFDEFVTTDRKFRYKDLVDYCRTRPKLEKVFELMFLEEICYQYSYQAVICKPYMEKVIEEINAPEPFDDGQGHIIDRWTGEIIGESEVKPTETTETTEQTSDNSEQINNEVATNQDTQNVSNVEGDETFENSSESNEE